MSRILISEEAYARLLDANGNSLTSVNGALKVDIGDSINVDTQGVTYSTTRAWDDVTFGDGSASEIHDSSTHGRLNIYGQISGSSTLNLQFSDTSATWYTTHHVVMVGDDGIVDGAFDDVAVPYVRLLKQSEGDVSGTILITGKSI